jgi:hypothetical protein
MRTRGRRRPAAPLAERQLAADSVVLARKAAGVCADAAACAAGAESFEVLFSLGARTSLAAVARGNHAAQLAPTGIELADDLRQTGAQRRAARRRLGPRV